MRLESSDCRSLLASATRGFLCTHGDGRQIDAVPVCFVSAGDAIVTPIDLTKAKSTTDLARAGNVRRRPQATMVCDHWDATDWSRLWWVRAHLTYRSDVDAADLSAYASALRAKYSQYAGDDFAGLLVFDVRRLVGWRADPG